MYVFKLTADYTNFNAMYEARTICKGGLSIEGELSCRPEFREIDWPGMAGLVEQYRVHHA
ncbi:MAG TPA: hypothetical protein VHU23_15195 [Rhizomicrobium sp.]|nr:hypothetical protein [Rhizomicrobium sp.]